MLQRRPDPVVPGPGQESVWDYPRPPRLEPSSRLVEVSLSGAVLARSTRALRLCETAGPPCYYLPPDDVDRSRLRPGYGQSTCEWLGEARYWTVAVSEQPSQRVDNAAWSYPQPWEGFEVLANRLAFYPQLLECRVDGELVRAQEGGFYGGWITDDIVGPWKGAPGTGHW